MERNISKHFLIASIIISLAAIYRVIPHPSNFAPISAIAIFGGYMSRKSWWYIAVPFAALFFSDLFLNNTIYRSFFPSIEGFVWFSPYMIGSFIAFGGIILIALNFLKKVKTLPLLVISLIGSFLFFIITNAGSWLVSPLYPKNLLGLSEALYAGLPFLGDTILGDLVFTFSIFGIYVLSAKRFINNDIVIAA